MFEEKLRAFCEGLEMENIDKLLTGTSDDFRLIGRVMAQRIKDAVSGNPLTEVYEVRQNTAFTKTRQVPQVSTQIFLCGSVAGCKAKTISGLCSAKYSCANQRKTSDVV